MMRTAWLALVLVLAAVQAGCVTRRVMITSDPPGAVVYRNGQPIGATPVEEPFIYYGRYHYRFVADGYQPLDLYPDFATPWYEYPGLDFVFENFFPFTFRDKQEVHAKMIRLAAPRPEDVRNEGENLRNRGKMIQRPPDAPPRTPRPAPVPVETAPPPVAPGVSASPPGVPSPVAS
jgi:hypothetical protein